MRLLFLFARPFLFLSFPGVLVIPFGARLPTLAPMEAIAIIAFWCVEEMTLRRLMVILPTMLAMFLRTQGRTASGSVSYAVSKGATRLIPLLHSLGFLFLQRFAKFPFLFNQTYELLAVDALSGILVRLVHICRDVLAGEHPPGARQRLRDC